MGDDEVDMQALIRKYVSDSSELDPQAREQRDRIQAEIMRRRAAGKIAPPRPDDNFAIGLDDNFSPLPPVPPEIPRHTEQEIGRTNGLTCRPARPMGSHFQGLE